MPLTVFPRAKISPYLYSILGYSRERRLCRNARREHHRERMPSRQKMRFKTDALCWHALRSSDLNGAWYSYRYGRISFRCQPTRSPLASAQSTISGQVKDSSGAVISGVTVEAASEALIGKVAHRDDERRRPINYCRRPAQDLCHLLGTDRPRWRNRLRPRRHDW